MFKYEQHKSSGMVDMIWLTLSCVDQTWTPWKLAQYWDALFVLVLEMVWHEQLLEWNNWTWPFWIWLKFQRHARLRNDIWHDFMNNLFFFMCQACHWWASCSQSLNLYFSHFIHFVIFYTFFGHVSTFNLLFYHYQNTYMFKIFLFFIDNKN